MLQKGKNKSFMLQDGKKNMLQEGKKLCYVARR